MNQQISSKGILREIKTQMKHSNTRYLLIFDLDDTIFDTTYRRFFIYEHFLRQQYNLPTLSLNLFKTCYDFIPLIKNNLTFMKHRSEIIDNFGKFFLSRPLLYFDIPFPGTSSFFTHIQHRKITIIFLTGRSKETMEPETRLTLKMYSFLKQKSPHYYLFMKEDNKLSDLQFKSRKLKSILAQFPERKFVIFDNESENCKIFKEILPSDATIVRFNSVQKRDSQFNGFILESWIS